MSRNGSGEYASVALEAAAWAPGIFEPVLYDFIAAAMWVEAAEWLAEEVKKRGWAEFRGTGDLAVILNSYLPRYRFDRDGQVWYVRADGGGES